MANLWRRRFSFSRRGWLPPPAGPHFFELPSVFHDKSETGNSDLFFSYFRQKKQTPMGAMKSTKQL